MPATYEPIATYTVTSAQSSYTFNSIPSTYTDLVLISSTKFTATNSHATFQINGDTGTNYSCTFVYGDGSTAASGRASNISGGYFGRGVTGEFAVGITHFQNYSNTTTYKTVLSRGSAATSLTIAYVNLWRNTAAINSLKLEAPTDTFTTGSTFTLYGIKAA
jgi:hypothetical protein